MTIRFSPSLLRRVLMADAALCAVAGAAMLAGAGGLSAWLGLPASFLTTVGAVLLACAALIGAVATRPEPPRPAVWAIIVVNALWAADSVLLLLSGWVRPTGFGVTAILVQAAAVLAFAEAEYLCIRRAPAPAV